MDRCKNCDHPLTGKFCSNCGQKADTRSLNWRWLRHEVQHSVFHVDRGILFTLKQLFTRPGHTINEYLEGKRKRYFPPISMILIPAAVYSLLMYFFMPDVSGMIASEQSRKVMETTMRMIKEKYALFELALLPLFSFSSWLLLRRYGHNYVEHVVINAFLAGQRIVLNVLVLPSNLLGLAASMVIGSVVYLVYLIYWVFGFAQLYEKRGGAAPAIRAMLAFLLAYIILLTLIVGGTIIYALVTGPKTT